MSANNYVVSEWLIRTGHFLERAADNKNQSLELEILTEADTLLQEGEDRDMPLTEVEVLRVMNRLAIRARKFGKAQKYAQLLFNKTRKEYYAAAELLSHAMYHRGKMVEAQEHLSLIPETRLTRAGKKRKSDVDRITMLDQASAIATTTLASDDPMSRAQKANVLSHLNDAQRPAGDALLATVGLAKGRRRQKQAPAETAQNPQNGENGQDDIGLVFCGGFKWSGASAVRDYLIGFENVASPRADFRIFTEKDVCIRDIYESFTAKDADALDAATKGFVLEKLLGITLSDPKPRRLLKTRAAALLPHAGEGDAGWIEQSGTRFLKAVQATRQSFPRNQLQEFIETCSRVVCPAQTRVCVYDSVLRAFDGDLFALLRKGHLLSVFRDPRDMYATHCLRGGWTEGVETYATELSAMLEAYNAFSGKRTKAVQFERFVLSPAYREEIRTLTLGPDTTPRAEQNFKAEDSATNIGIHADFEDREAIAYLEKTFPDLCIDVKTADWAQA